MMHDGQNPSAQAGLFSEEVAKAQSSLAGILHQIHGLLPIASEPMGVVCGEPGAELPNQHRREFLAVFLGESVAPEQRVGSDVVIENESRQSWPGPARRH